MSVASSRKAGLVISTGALEVTTECVSSYGGSFSEQVLPALCFYRIFFLYVSTVCLACMSC